MLCWFMLRLLISLDRKLTKNQNTRQAGIMSLVYRDKLLLPGRINTGYPESQLEWGNFHSSGL